MSIVERYRQPLLRAFDPNWKEFLDTAKEDILQMVVKAVNYSIGADLLVRQCFCLARYLKWVYPPTSQPHPPYKEQLRYGKQLSRCNVILRAANFETR